jgi:hemolysin activation/secretion protein
LNDAINLSYSTNLNDDSQTKDIKSFTSGISIPFGYSTISYDYSRSEFRGTNQGVSGPIRLTGYSQRNNATIDHVLYNKGNLRLSTNASLTTKSSASYLNLTKIDTSERKLTIGSIGFTASNYFKNGINLYLKPSYYKGLKILNAKQDEKNLSSTTPKAQFDYFKLYASISKRFTIPKTEIPFTLSTEIDSQYAKQTLFGTEQFSVGGYYSVRGFRENYINGDSGYYLRNKANFNLGSLAAPLIKNGDGLLGKNLAHLNKLSIEPFYDYGYVKNKYVSNGGDGRLAGSGVKTIFSSKYFNASLTYSKGTNLSHLITGTKKENNLVYFELSASCC